jgi:hypothetical protein
LELKLRRLAPELELKLRRLALVQLAPQVLQQLVAPLVVRVHLLVQLVQM